MQAARHHGASCISAVLPGSGCLGFFAVPVGVFFVLFLNGTVRPKRRSSMVRTKLFDTVTY